MEKVRIRDPGWKKVGSGIRDKHPRSATLPQSTTNHDPEDKRKLVGASVFASFSLFHQMDEELNKFFASVFTIDDMQNLPDPEPELVGHRMSTIKVSEQDIQCKHQAQT